MIIEFLRDSLRIEYSLSLVSHTYVKTGKTDIFENGVRKTTWDNVNVSELLKRMKHLIETGKIITDFKPEL